jgi:hypothetical protein
MSIGGFISARLDEAAAASGRPTQAGGLHELKLARMAVIREVVAEHECDAFSQICLTCRRHGSDEGWASETWPCPTIRQIAALWADHPDYEAAWAPHERQHADAATVRATVPRQRRASNGVWLHDVSEAGSGWAGS